MNLASSDNSIEVTKVADCEYDIKLPDELLQLELFKENTLSVILTGLGTNASKLKADVRISSNPFNLLSIDANGGLLVSSNVATNFTPSATADTDGSEGDLTWDDDYIYVKTSAGWKRAALSTF